MAVGNYGTRPGELLPFAAAWDGAEWRVVRVRRSGLRILSRVSCVSARACVAVGAVLRGGYPSVSAAVWDGRVWRAGAPRRPVGETYSGLDDVSCISARSCVAVGVYSSGRSERFRTLVQTWNGRKWTLRSSPSPRVGEEGSALRGVACFSARFCMAVGYRYAGPGAALVERFDGAAWTLSSTPRPAASGTVSTLGVECPAKRWCVGVGFWADRGGRRYAHALLQTWDGRRWRVEPVPAPAGAISTLLATVSCSAPDRCMALGSYSTADELAGDGTEDAGGPLVLVWNGTAWTIGAAPP
jgi:hypothetical protein